MALAVRRAVQLCTQRGIVTAAVQNSKKLMSDPLEHPIGLEAQEMKAMAAGNMNPFELEVHKRGASTKASPNVVVSSEPYRIVGCVCEEDAIGIQWMWLHKGHPRRCGCGYWFELQDRK